MMPENVDKIDIFSFDANFQLLKTGWLMYSKSIMGQYGTYYSELTVAGI